MIERPPGRSTEGSASSRIDVAPAPSSRPSDSRRTHPDHERRTQKEVHRMAIAPQRIGIGIRRHFTTAGVHPYDAVVWERRDARITNYRDGAVAFEQLDVEVPEALEPQRHQHPGPEVLPGHPRTPRARVVAAPGGRPGGRHHHRLGHQGRLLRRRRGGGDLPGRAEAPDHPPEGRLQLAGVVQHRGGRRAPAGVGLLHPRRRRHHGLHPQLVHGGGSHLQGWLGRRASTCRASAPRTSC